MYWEVEISFLKEIVYYASASLYFILRNAGKNHILFAASYVMFIFKFRSEMGVKNLSNIPIGNRQWNFGI
jgi:hypothetical protein